MMDTYKIETYGERFADHYDEWYSTFDEAAIETLAEFAEGGRALELGIGTGRIALPLLKRGVEVHGIDASTAMVERLRAKPGGESLPVVMGNFADLEVENEFKLIYIVFNTFFVLLTQEEQVRCFRNVARRLTRDGVFVIEAFVPDLTRFSGGQANKAIKVTTELVELDVSQHYPAEQRVVGQKVVLTQGSVRLYPIQIRYCWPSEMDLMAQLAGLRLRHRWSNWQQEPFTSESVKHISVYERGTEEQG
jgi:SAM-dependent methyltransferase